MSNDSKTTTWKDPKEERTITYSLDVLHKFSDRRKVRTLPRNLATKPDTAVTAEAKSWSGLH